MSPSHSHDEAARAEQRTRLARLIAAERIVAALRDVLADPRRAVVVKGLAAAHTLYGDPLERPFADIDVFTTPRALEEVLAPLVDQGWRLKDGTLPTTRYHRWPWNALDPGSISAELHHPAYPSLTIDVQWRLAMDDIVRGGIRALLEDARVIPVGGARVATLSPADTTVLTALFIVRDFFLGTSGQLLTDLERAVEQWFRDDPRAVVEHARRRGLLRVLAASVAWGLARGGGTSPLHALGEALRAAGTAPGPTRWANWMPAWGRRGRVATALYPLWPDRTRDRMRVLARYAQLGVTGGLLRPVFRGG